jgi:hypothetical protein
MTPSRFNLLVDIYGADLKRWPAAERDQARAMLAEDASEVRANLAAAAALDDLLTAHRIADPGAALVRQVIGSAPPPAPGGARLRTGWRPGWQMSWWWRGAGLAGAGIAGTLAGAVAVSTALHGASPSSLPDWTERGTSFSELPADWSGE